MCGSSRQMVEMAGGPVGPPAIVHMSRESLIAESLADFCMISHGRSRIFIAPRKALCASCASALFLRLSVGKIHLLPVNKQSNDLFYVYKISWHSAKCSDMQLKSIANIMHL